MRVTVEELPAQVGGFDLVYDGGVIEPDPQDCPWSTRLGTAIEREPAAGEAAAA